MNVLESESDFSQHLGQFSLHDLRCPHSLKADFVYLEKCSSCRSSQMPVGFEILCGIKTMTCCKNGISPVTMIHLTLPFILGTGWDSENGIPESAAPGLRSGMSSSDLRRQRMSIGPSQVGMETYRIGDFDFSSPRMQRFRSRRSMECA